MAIDPTPAWAVRSAVTIGEMTVDVCLNEGHAFDSQVTDHPVESGSDVSDNVRLEPEELQLECIVTNTPLVPDSGNSFFLPSSTLNGFLPIPAVLRTDQALGYLLKIRAEREPIQVVTQTRVYPSMLMESLSYSEDQGSGNALRFVVSFRELRIVTNQRAILRTKEPLHQRKKDTGYKPAKDTAAAANKPTVNPFVPATRKIQPADPYAGSVPGGKLVVRQDLASQFRRQF